MPEKSVIIKISDTEFQIEENKVFLLEDNIIYIEANGEQTDRIAQNHLRLNESLGSQIEGEINYLINLNNAGKNSPGARKVWQNMSNLDKTNKVAVFGIHPVARILASFVIGMTKRENILFFNNKEDALNWLKA